MYYYFSFFVVVIKCNSPKPSLSETEMSNLSRLDEVCKSVSTIFNTVFKSFPITLFFD